MEYDNIIKNDQFVNRICLFTKIKYSELYCVVKIPGN